MAKKNNQKSNKLKIIPLGGLSEVGKNMTLLEYDNDIIIIDCGMTFPTTDMLGIDCVIPDFSYVKENASKIKGLILTHAHEDHIGGVPFLLNDVNVPIFTGRLAAGLLKLKFKEHKIERFNLNEFNEEEFSLGFFKITPIHVTHSVADAYALLIKTPVGNIFHTGDFKFDYTPIDKKPTDIAKLASIGENGVKLLISDSTNATREGFSKSESSIKNNLSNYIKKSNKRIIVTTFSSNIHRIQALIDIAFENNRKVVITGRSMENCVKVSAELGFLHIPEGIIIPIKSIKDYYDDELMILTTGSQGEPNSALTRIAYNQHAEIKITSNDLVILSSSIIPGNEIGVYDIINEIMLKGASVIYSENAEVHASGHGNREELKLMHALLKPEFFMPVHGEIRLLVSHSELAQEMGEKPENIIIADNGNIVELTNNSIKLSKQKVPAGAVLVDGLGIGDVGSKVLSERKSLSTSGLIILSCAFNKEGKIVSDIKLSTKGFIYVKEYGHLLDDALKELYVALENAYRSNKSENEIKDILEHTLKNNIYRQTNRSPVIMPVYTEV